MTGKIPGVPVTWLFAEWPAYVVALAVPAGTEDQEYGPVALHISQTAN